MKQKGEDIERKIGQNIKDFDYNYFKNQEFDIYRIKLNFLMRRISRNKTDSSKRKYFIELYATYLQLIENFTINIFSLTTNNLLGNIFLSTKEIRDKMKYFSRETGNEFVEQFMKDWIFPYGKQVKEKGKYQEQIRTYKKMLNESINDHSSDYDFLNSYKHGFRVKGAGKITASAFMDNNPSNKFKLGEYNASVIYFEKQKIKKVDQDKVFQLYRNTVAFNWERVSQKSVYLINMLENTRNIFLSLRDEYYLDKISHLKVLDKEEFSKHHGCFRIKEKVLKYKVKKHHG